MKTLVTLFVSLIILGSYVPEEEQKSRGESIFFVMAVIGSEDGRLFKLQMMRLTADQARKKADWLKKAEEERRILEKEFGDSEAEEKSVGPFWMPDFYGHREELDRLLAEAAAITGPQILIEVSACDMPSDLFCYSFLVKVRVEKELVEGSLGGIQVWRHNFWKWKVVYP